MTNTFQFTPRCGALLLCALALGGCSHSPYSLTSSSPIIATGMVPGGAMQTARIEQVQKQTVIDCPGPGSAACEINWRHLQEGLTAAQVTEWLGEPTQQSGPDIYVQKIVAEWHYEHKGVVYFENEQLQYVDMPQSFVYPL